MNKFIVEGKIVLRDGDTLTVKTEAKHEIFIVFEEGEFTVCNESGTTERKLQLATIFNDGDIKVSDG